jgi:hypothetical protein
MTTTDRPIPPRPPNVNDPQRPRRAISQASADAESPAARTFPEADLPADLPDVNARPAPAAEDVAFTRGPARRPLPRVADPLLQWASGLPTKERTIYAGWLVECGKDEALDTAMHQAGFAFVTIRHGNGNLVTHWAVETAGVFVVAEGVQSIGEMKGDGRRYGIAFGWRIHESGRPQSQLRARVFLRELLAVGYAEPLLLTVKGTLTGDLIAALTRQYDVLDANAALRTAAGKTPWDLPLYAFSIPLGPGQEVTRGSGQATKEITPIVTTIPDPVTRDHLKAHWIGRAWVSLIEDRIDATIAWSIAESAAIAEGADQEQGGE